MSESTVRTDDEPVVAEGIDDETVEANRRLFTGWRSILIASLAAVYAAFHMAALNGLSLSGMTGIELPFLPSFPLETWNFRIVHVAGALFLGFMMFGPRLRFGESAVPAKAPSQLIAWVLLAAALVACVAALSFALRIQGGAMWNGIAPEYRNAEIYFFGIPLLIATFGALLLGWLDKSPRDRFVLSDLVLGVCAIAVALYLITMYGTLMRNSTGTPFAPIGISLAAVAGVALIMELTRRVTGFALLAITARPRALLRRQPQPAGRSCHR